MGFKNGIRCLEARCVDDAAFGFEGVKGSKGSKAKEEVSWSVRGSKVKGGNLFADAERRSDFATPVSSPFC